MRVVDVSAGRPVRRKAGEYEIAPRPDEKSWRGASVCSRKNARL